MLRTLTRFPLLRSAVVGGVLAVLGLPIDGAAQPRLSTASGGTEAAPFVDLGHEPERLGGGTPAVLTHSASQTVTPENSVSCNSDGFHASSSYFRAFSLDAFGIVGDFAVTSVEMGVELASGAGGTQPVEVALYAALADPFPEGGLSLLSSVSLSLPDQSATLVSIPLADATAPAGSELVVEVFTPDGRVDGNGFFIGSNADGQTAPSYLEAEGCDAPSPVDLADFGYPNMHIVLSVTGEDIGVVSAEGEPALPRTVTLGAGYPNPFNPRATVPFQVDQPTELRLAVYDALGREVAVLAQGFYAPGRYAADFEASGLPSGPYMTRLEANGRVYTQSLTLLK